jgi:hypothetical protein
MYNRQIWSPRPEQGNRLALIRGHIGILVILLPHALGAQPMYNVKQYGAVGNGSANDTSAVQAAINAAHTAGYGTVYFPSSTGCYMVTSLTFYSNLGYTGQSGSVCVGSLSNSVSMVQTPSSSAFSNARISYLIFQGIGTTSSGPECVGLTAPTNIVIDHVTATKCAGDGFYITGYGTNHAIPGDGLLMTNSTASHTGRNGMSIITGKNITVRNSVFEYKRPYAQDGDRLKRSEAGNLSGPLRILR